MPGRRSLMVLVALLVACCAPVAWGAENGRIYYNVRNDQTDVLYSANADGTCATQLTHGEAIYDWYPSTPLSGAPVYYVHSIKDGGRLKDEQVWRMNPDGSGKRQVTDYALPPAQPNMNPTGYIAMAAISPDGSRLVMSLYDQDRHIRIYLAAADGSGLTRLTNTTDGSDVEPTWSPDGRSITFV